MNTAARRIEPTRSLLQGVPYVPAYSTATDGVLARWRASLRITETAESYAADQMAEHATMRIPNER